MCMCAMAVFTTDEALDDIFDQDFNSESERSKSRHSPFPEQVVRSLNLTPKNHSPLITHHRPVERGAGAQVH